MSLKNPKQMIGVLLIVIAGIFLLLVFNAGGSVEKALQQSKSYKCSVLLDNPYFQNVKIDSAVCVPSGSCLKGLNSLSFGLTDSGNLRFKTVDGMKALNYEISEGDKKEYSQSICTDDTSVIVQTFENNVLLQSQTVRLT